MPLGLEGTERVGVDLVSVVRLARMLEEETFLDRLLTPEERTRTDPTFLAGRLAAKEAICKAAGVAPPRWRDVVILGEGRPTIQLRGALGETIATCDVSISHERDMIIAVALVRLREP